MEGARHCSLQRGCERFPTTTKKSLTLPSLVGRLKVANRKISKEDIEMFTPVFWLIMWLGFWDDDF